MKISEKKTVIHTKLETNMIAAIEYVLALRKKNGVKANLLTLTKELGINSIDYAQTRNKQRGFTKAKIPGIVGKLQTVFGVRKEFLYNNEMPILNINESLQYSLQDDGGTETYSLSNKVKEQEQEIKHLKLQLEDKIKIIATQDLAIESFKALFSGKN